MQACQGQHDHTQTWPNSLGETSFSCHWIPARVLVEQGYLLPGADVKYLPRLCWDRECMQCHHAQSICYLCVSNWLTVLVSIVYCKAGVSQPCVQSCWGCSLLWLWYLPIPSTTTMHTILSCIQSPWTHWILYHLHLFLPYSSHQVWKSILAWSLWDLTSTLSYIESSMAVYSMARLHHAGMSSAKTETMWSRTHGPIKANSSVRKRYSKKSRGLREFPTLWMLGLLRSEACRIGQVHTICLSPPLTMRFGFSVWKSSPRTGKRLQLNWTKTKEDQD